MNSDRDNGGRFRPGAASPNPKGRPKKARGVDAAMLGALSEKVTVTEQGRRKRKSKLDITAAQIASSSLHRHAAALGRVLRVFALGYVTATRPQP